ncbi:MAG: efflux RND transporter periplasmic adaptor subunit [Kiritimatiellia bacterium]|nr:efflux RND transporter periplasmic adaptor subunit [Kiritimatiellia bacterium]
MKSRNLFLGIAMAAALLFAGVLRYSARRDGRTSADWIEVTEGPFRLWTEVEGELAARHVASVASRVNGPATLTFLAPEGATVRSGDALARFDSFQIEQDLARLDREYAVAETELRMLERAQQPLERAEIETALLDARAVLQTEEQYLKDSADLMGDALVSEQEIAQQRMKVEGLRARVAQIEMRRRLMEEHLHPARLEEARAKLDTVSRQRESQREQFEQTRVRAPTDGEIVYLDLPFGGERRPARIGDVLYRNQEFICIPDPSEWIARCRVPEQDLSRIRPGMPAHLTLRAFPTLVLTGTVETIAAMGQTDARFSGRRFFPVTIRMTDVPPDLKSGLTSHIRLLTRTVERAVLIPRRAVHWEQGRPFCRLIDGTRTEDRALELGFGNERFFEVLSGVVPGDRVLP